MDSKVESLEGESLQASDNLEILPKNLEQRKEKNVCTLGTAVLLFQPTAFMSNKLGHRIRATSQ